MAINKVGSKGIADGSVAAIDFAPNSVTSDKLADGTITNANLSNSSVTLAGTSIALGASGTLNNKFIDWQSVVVSDGSTVTTMVAGNGYFVNNTSAAGLVKLPISASIGDVVAIKDYAGNFGTNSLTIQRNGHNIQGVANDSLISTNRASLVLVYVDSTKGWLYWEEHNVADLQGPSFTSATGGTITTSGDFKIHTFTGDGCFVVSQIGNSPVVPTGGPVNVDYLTVAGGGGGGLGQGGGGGAGGYRTTFPSPSCNAGSFPITATTFPITVGAGGAGSDANPEKGTNGSNSIFSSITSTGGGGGGSAGNDAGATGGSGGGAGETGTGGSGNTPPTSPSQGNAGGPSNCGAGGGGGGASASGSSNSSQTGGAGGSGAPNQINGSNVTYAGGGGGGGQHPSPGGSGGSGGGGTGGVGGGPSRSAGTPGTINTGGGGGSGCTATPGAPDGGNGGSGIVIIRYKFQ